MEITRLYNNSDSELLRIDTITVDVQPPTYKDLRIGNDPSLQMKVGPQRIKTRIMTGGNTITNRTVATIEITGDFDSYDTSGPNYDFTWAIKDLGNGQKVRFDMSNLPIVGSSV